MQTVVVRTYTGVIARPIDEVRSQYCDMRYHVLRNVHPDIHFTLHDVTADTCSFSQEIVLAGMRQTDEIVNTILPNGDLRSDFISGMNKGGTLLVQFAVAGLNATVVHAVLRVPLQGIKVLLAPLLGAAAHAALKAAFAEDRKDLEGGHYAQYRLKRLVAT